MKKITLALKIRVLSGLLSICLILAVSLPLAFATETDNNAIDIGNIVDTSIGEGGPAVNGAV